MMVIEVQTKIGEALYKFIIDDVDEMQALHKAAVLGNPKLYCKLCKNDKFFRLDSNKDKDGNIYVNVVCTACWAKSKLGQYKSKGYFWHDFERYEKGGVIEDNFEQQQNAFNESSKDLPF